MNNKWLDHGNDMTVHQRAALFVDELMIHHQTEYARARRVSVLAQFGHVCANAELERRRAVEQELAIYNQAAENLRDGLRDLWSLDSEKMPANLWAVALASMLRKYYELHGEFRNFELTCIPFKGFGRITVTVQRETGKTPAELLNEARAESARYRDALEEIKSAATGASTALGEKTHGE